jgi:AP-2 complex subunit mu-1
VRSIEGSTFLYIRHKDMYFVAVTRQNVNAASAFHFLYALVDIFKGYFDEDFDEDSLRDNFTLVYELLDEVLDFGYPQNCALDVLKMYINTGSLRAPIAAAEQKKMTSMITGARDWRREGIVHKKNEVFIDVLESVNLLVSATGAVLRSDVSGQVIMRAMLSGMPECKLGLNDKLILDRDAASRGGGGGAGGGKKKTVGVEIDDCTFHRCVQLSKFDGDRTITFVPPDGEFELMRYRITENINLPFRIIPVIEEQGKARVVMNIKAIANFASQLFATNVTIKIPVRRAGRGRRRRCCCCCFCSPRRCSCPRCTRGVLCHQIGR